MKKIIVANWKMQKNYTESINWCKKHVQELNNLIKDTNKSIIICPEFTALSPILEILYNTNIKLGAQNCSNDLAGAYTGEVSSISLKELNCEYCIVGHMEQRKYRCETNKRVGEKARLLIKNKISPIICIGDKDKNTTDINKILKVLKNQIKTILEEISNISTNNIYIAYEPGWSIGQGIPDLKFLEAIFSNLNIFMLKKYKNITFKFLYGGGINSENIKELEKVTNICGYLIGSASLDFKKFKKIILSIKD